LPSSLPSQSPSQSQSPSSSHTALPSLPSTQVPSLLPSSSLSQSFSKSQSPSLPPTTLTSLSPTEVPSLLPSSLPSLPPTVLSSLTPSQVPFRLPNSLPSQPPSLPPTALPSLSPTHIPSFLPSSSPLQSPSQSQSPALSSTTFLTSTFTTSSPMTSAATTTYAPTISASTTLPSSLITNKICVDQPGQISLITNNSTTTCAEIHQLENKQDREGMCTAVTTSLEEMIHRCPLACGNNRCYSPVQACWNADVREAFKVAGSQRTCVSLSLLGTSTVRSKKELHGQLCRSHAQHLTRHDDEATRAGKIYDHGLVQDLCPMACQHLKCTCADKTFPFVTVPLYNISERKMEESTERSCASLLQKGSPQGMSMSMYINLVCLLDIRAAHHALQVHHMCPSVCGFRKECFCRDSRKPVPTPGRPKTSRYCRAARFPQQEVKNVLCDQTKQAAFSRSCPLTCGDPACQGEDAVDSLDTLSFDRGRTATSCWIISKGDVTYTSRYCNAVESDLQVKGKVLCPNACKDYVN